MTDCFNADVRDALPDYLNDRLDSARRRDVESHLAGCEACREELSLLRALRATVRRAPAVDIEAIAASIPPYRAPARRNWATRGRVAAAIVAITVGGASIALLRTRTPASPVEVTRTVVGAPAIPQPAPALPVPTVVEPPVTEHVGSARAPGGTADVRELAIAGGSIADLSDRELSALVEGIESLDGVPSAEVEAPEPVSMSAQEGT